MPLLSPKALPGLAVVTRALPAARLSKDAALPDLAAELVRDGYAGGRERVFEGTSRTLRLATSRALVFHTATGAASFLAYVHRHAQQWFGLTTEVNSLTSAGRTGWMFRPPSCSCPRASPLLVGILGEGAQLTWLAISGPGVTPRMLADLLAPTLSTTA